MMTPQIGANICRRQLFHDQNSGQTQKCTDDQRKRAKPLKRHSALKEVCCRRGSRINFSPHPVSDPPFHLSLFPLDLSSREGLEVNLSSPFIPLNHSLLTHYYWLSICHPLIQLQPP